MSTHIKMRYYIGLLIVSLLLSGCWSRSWEHNTACLHQPYHTSCGRCQHAQAQMMRQTKGEILANQLRDAGVAVVELGDHILLVFPTAKIFSPGTDDMQDAACPILNLLVRYLNYYSKMLITVAGYADVFESYSMNRALSQRQAESVVSYMRASGIDTRVLYAIGYGHVYPVVKRDLTAIANSNNRIEITLEK